MQQVISKYIYQTSEGYKVDLRKSGCRATCRFNVREFGSREKALESAKDWLRERHLHLFGVPLSEKQKYGMPRNKKTFVIISGKKFKLVSGLYCEFVKGKPAYFTVSKAGGKKRFSISKLGAESAHQLAYKEALENTCP